MALGLRCGLAAEPLVVLSFRSLFAGLMLAVVASGGVGAPLVHEAMHAADREALQAEHAADGRHTTVADGKTHASEECPAPKPALDLDCVLCHGLTAALVAEAATVPGLAPAAEAYAARPPPGASADVSTPTGRGPPSA